MVEQHEINIKSALFDLLIEAVISKKPATIDKLGPLMKEPAAAASQSYEAPEANDDEEGDGASDGLDSFRDRVKANKFRDIFSTLPSEIQEAYDQVVPQI